MQTDDLLLLLSLASSGCCLAISIIILDPDDDWTSTPSIIHVQMNWARSKSTRRRRKLETLFFLEFQYHAGDSIETAAYAYLGIPKPHGHADLPSFSMVYSTSFG